MHVVSPSARSWRPSAGNGVPRDPQQARTAGRRVGGAVTAMLSAVVAGRVALAATDPAGTAPRDRLR